MTRRTRVLVTTTAAALMGLAFPAVATETPSTLLGTAGGVRYWQSTTQLAESDASMPTVQEVSASCGPNWQAVAGGLSVGARTGQGISDAWSGNNVDWSVKAWQRDAPESPLASFAVCMKTDELSSVTEPSVNITANSPVFRGVWCAEGSAVSGGVYTSGEGAEFALSSSYPTDGGDADLTPDDGWVSYVNYTGDGGDNVSFGVRCLENTSLTYRSASTQVAPGSTSSTKAVCPKKSVVLGGGVQVSGSAKVSHVTASRPWDSKDAKKVPEDGWRGGIVNTSSLQVSMTVHAVCRGI